ncbi:MAG: hypothetical protein KJZ85_07815 [Rhodobacteraceae bacterium]|jgi:hypothetical protein|nr:hypothetical protein [Paracoccaceae bacterium]
MALGLLIGGSGTGLVAAALVWSAGFPFWLALAVYAAGGALATLVMAALCARGRASDGRSDTAAAGPMRRA